MDSTSVYEGRNELEIVDVREPKEWREGRIEGARHIPMDDLPDRMEEKEVERKIVTVCRSGARSGEMAEFLQSKGLDAANMEGGMTEWAKRGLPVTTPDGRAGKVV